MGYHLHDTTNQTNDGRNNQNAEGETPPNDLFQDLVFRRQGAVLDQVGVVSDQPLHLSEARIDLRIQFMQITFYANNFILEVSL